MTSPSQVSFSETSLADLPEAYELPPDVTEQVNPPENVCPTCGLEIVRLPGERGRRRKYHAECRPSAQKSSGPTVVRVSKKDLETADQVERAIERARRGLGKCVAIVSLVDPYDAFVIHVNSEDLLDNLRPVLMRFDWARNVATNVSTAGSIFGLVLTIFTTLLPIGAHHGLIPNKKISQVLLSMPTFLLRLQESAAEQGEAGTTHELLRRAMSQMKEQTEARMRQATAEDGSVT